ncbi:MAG: bacillithiol transferase BstA [Candidatus Eisenbacteria bacterium]|nr:bacillithiol transferase BstA [Candidatus Eisenbacteria bacterium]
MPENDPRYPIGRYQRPAEIPPALRAEWLRQVAEAPAGLRAVVTGLTEAQLDTPYRDGGWTVRQVVHHVPDSHLNAYTRFRLALTEEAPTVKTYEEARWAGLPDARTAPVEMSLALLDALHARWMLLLEAMGDAEFHRTFRHPDLGLMALDTTLGLYAWHGRHHAAQIRSLRERKGW